MLLCSRRPHTASKDTNDSWRQTLGMQNRAMQQYATWRSWTIAMQVREVNPWAARQEAREKRLNAARRRDPV
jgi:predicted transcriptional regulator